MNNQQGRKTTFGVMTNGDILKRWQISAIEQLLDLGLKLSLVIENQDDNEVKVSKWKKYSGKNSFYNFYTRLLFNPPNLKNTNASVLLSGTQNIKVQPIHKGKYSTYFPEEVVEKIKAMDLDFILRFGFNIIKGDILRAAKYGIWSFHHDDEQVIRGGPPGFWEIMENHEVNGVLLQRLTDELDGGFLIRKGMYPIIYHSYSTHVNELLNEGVDMLVFAARNLLNHGEIKFEKIYNKKNKIYRFPGNGVMVKFFMQQVVSRLKFNLRDLFLHENWNIGLVNQSVEDLISSRKLEKITFAPESSSSTFAADVFIKVVDKGIRLFFEEFDYKRYRGVISHISFDIETEKFSDPRQLIEEDYHLAFPYLWEYKGSGYMIPESSASGKLIAYKIDEKHQIIEKKLVLNKGCVDAVIFKYEEYFWIFCTQKKYGTNQNLFAYYSKNPWEGWRPHRQNPIIADARSARMAGDIFSFQGQLYRPSQRNNKVYGEAIVINRIFELTPKSYKEMEEFRIYPADFSTYNKGVHTLSFSGNYMAVDAKNYKFVGSEFFRKLKLKFTR